MAAFGAAAAEAPLSRQSGTEQRRETRPEPVTVAVGLIIVGVAIVGAILAWAGFDDEIAGPSPAVESGAITLLVALAEFGGAVVVARGLLFPLRLLPGDESLLCGPSRRAASTKSRSTERAAVFLVCGASILITAILLPLAGLAELQVCAGGPCVPPLPPLSVELALALGGSAAIGVGAALAWRARGLPGPSVAGNA